MGAIFYIILGYVAICILIYFIQEKFIFHPEKLPANFKFKYDRPFKEVFFDVERNVRINGLHFAAPTPKGIILYFHGNTRSIKGWAKYSKDFTKYGYDLIMIDYRGFGKSTGKRSEDAMLKDAQFVYQKMKATYAEDQIIVYGRSIGSGFAVRVASLNTPRFCILDAPYYSFQNISSRYLPFLPMPFLLKYPIRADLWMEYVKCHTYILHGTRDRLIPIRSSERLAAIAPERITLIRIEGGGHNNLPSFPQYHAFLRDILLY
jgi:pimeloyl-ACP methyl ester carboxylesterase